MNHFLLTFTSLLSFSYAMELEERSLVPTYKMQENLSVSALIKRFDDEIFGKCNMLPIIIAVNTLSPEEKKQFKDHVMGKKKEINETFTKFLKESECLKKLLGSDLSFEDNKINSLIALPLSLESDPEKARAWLNEMNAEHVLSDLDHREAIWQLMIGGIQDKSSQTYVPYCNLPEAELQFVKDFPEIIKRAHKEVSSFSYLTPFQLFVEWGIGLETHNSSLTKELRAFLAPNHDLYQKMEESVQTVLALNKNNPKINGKSFKEYDICKELYYLDLNFLTHVAAIELKAHQQEFDPNSLESLISILQKAKESLKINSRKDFETGKLENYKEFYNTFQTLLESEVIRCADPDTPLGLKNVFTFAQTILENGGKFSRRSQYELHRRLSPHGMFKLLNKWMDKNEIKYPPSHLKALVFMEELFAAHKTLQKEEEKKPVMEEKIQDLALIGRDEDNIDAQALILDAIKTTTSFSAIEKTWRDMLCDAQREAIEMILSSEYGPLKHLIFNLYDNHKGLTEKEWEALSSDVRTMLDKAKETFEAAKEESKKKKKDKKTPEEKALNKMVNCNPKKENIPSFMNPKEYTPSDLIEQLKNKTISWNNLTKLIESLGGTSFAHKEKRKVTFHFVGNEEEPFLVSDKVYKEHDGEKKWKHQVTRTTDVPHGKKEGLDKQFQEDVYALLVEIFGEKTLQI